MTNILCSRYSSVGREIHWFSDWGFIT